MNYFDNSSGLERAGFVIVLSPDQQPTKVQLRTENNPRQRRSHCSSYYSGLGKDQQRQSQQGTTDCSYEMLLFHTLSCTFFKDPI